MRVGRFAFLGCVAWATACGHASTDLAGMPACTLPAGLKAIDAAMARDACIGARARLTCDGPNGTGASCLSDDPHGCPGLVGYTCHNQCAAGEYAAECGGVGPGPVPDPPAGCKFAGAIPAGIGMYCCPCGS